MTSFFGLSTGLQLQPQQQQQQQQTAAAAPQDLPIHSRNYLASLQSRLQRVEQLLQDETPAALGFSYDLDSSSSSSSSSTGLTRAQQQNLQLEQKVQQLAAATPQQGQELLSRWQRAAHRNPDRQAGVVVPVVGLQGLAARISGAAEMTEAILQAAAATARDTEALAAKHNQMNAALGRIKKRHAVLGHSLIRAVGLVEGLAVSRGVCERNPRCEAANEQLLAQIQEEFQWADWQQRIDGLRVWLSSLQQQKPEACSSSSSSSSEEQQPAVAPALLRLLTVQAETVQQLLQSLANTEAAVSRLQASALAARSRAK
ncbi:hypothetical protein, conserved [Eimeria tenella]|uniref:Nucleoporin Nup54 alpha-helical domain-containing protein n=1 Tax=Eimeria tenella TaxID=5802 RepID=U6KLW2_EIMTE|nr:hypothetical protein, conserved [Eimeria tenella]CDJ37816.1 hypothetical protein, conserved [Eimeria tenella]|eukprot:XP_013228654.1 hypothetical protein, conserved [Eimeria tenella]